MIYRKIFPLKKKKKKKKKMSLKNMNHKTLIEKSKK